MEEPTTRTGVIEGEESQESVNRVPESPPLHTQEENSQNIEEQQDDIEAQISGVSVKETIKSEDQVVIKYDNENIARSSREDGTSQTSRINDVIIDMDGVEMEEISDNDLIEPSKSDLDEFPDEDDALLVSAAENLEDPESIEPPETLEDLELPPSTASNAGIELDEQLKADDDKRRKVIETFRRFKPLDKIFPDVRCSEHNTVAFTVKPNYTPGDPLEPNPTNCVAKWESKYVPMPFCHENIIFVKSRVLSPSTQSKQKCDNNDGNRPSCQEDVSGSRAGVDDSASEEKVFAPTRKLRMWERIQETLTDVKILCSQDFHTVIRRYCRVNSEFKALDYCIEQILDRQERTHFFDKVVPFMISLVLGTSEIVTCPIPFLKKNLNHNISLSQKQVACLLANAFFSTFPRTKSQINTPSINFRELFTEEDEKIMMMKAQKIRCLINYFTRIEADMPQGVVTYSRKNLRHSNMPDWGKLDKRLTKLVPLLQGTIEDDSDGMLKVDFANCNLGGGVLGRGAVQEEILFVIYPELILTRLFTEKLNYNEAIIVTGCERFSKYLGYSLNFRYGGDYQDTTPYDSKGRRCTQIVAIDALYISRPTFQYHPRHILRELNKAYVGFTSPTSTPVAVATGKWGCGAFNGDPQLKTIIQMLAASHAGRDVVLYTFADVPCLNDILSICDSIGNMKIKDVWNLLGQYHSLCCAGGKISISLKDFCQRYADGQTWVKAKEESNQPSSSSASRPRPKQIPKTQFYSYEKRYSGPPDDATVAAITNGIDKINSPTKSLPPPVKRLREEEVAGLSETEIRQQILDETTNNDDKPTEVKIKTEVSTTENNDDTSSPTSSKRPKRLLDFYSSTEDAV